MEQAKMHLFTMADGRALSETFFGSKVIARQIRKKTDCRDSAVARILERKNSLGDMPTNFLSTKNASEYFHKLKRTELTGLL